MARNLTGIISLTTLFAMTACNESVLGSVDSVEDNSDLTLDSDGDGLTDVEERSLNTDPFNPDSDNDGVEDGDEVELGSDPNDADSDDDGIEDGLHIFNLNDANTDILKGLPSGLNIVYYDTLNNALLEENPLTETYTNKTPNTQTIYARVENKNDCFEPSWWFLWVSC